MHMNTHSGDRSVTLCTQLLTLLLLNRLTFIAHFTTPRPRSALQIMRITMRITAMRNLRFYELQFAQE